MQSPVSQTVTGEGTFSQSTAANNNAAAQGTLNQAQRTGNTGMATSQGTVGDQTTLNLSTLDQLTTASQSSGKITQPPTIQGSASTASSVVFTTLSTTTLQL